MNNRYKGLIAILAACWPFLALADDAPLLSPQVETTTPPTGTPVPADAGIAGIEPAPAPTETAPAPVPDAPLLVIRFNQRRTYFANALRQAVRQAERTKAGLYYEVISIVPQGVNRVRDQRNLEDAEYNLELVINELEYQGVGEEYITVTSKTAPPGTSDQEIQIYVH